MAPLRNAAAVALLAILSVAAAVVFPTSLQGQEPAQSRAHNGRTKREADTSYECLIPVEQEVNALFIQCNALNDTEGAVRSALFANSSEAGGDNVFEYALLCPNASEASAAAPARVERSAEEAECLDAAYEDCGMQCVYSEANVTTCIPCHHGPGISKPLHAAARWLCAILCPQLGASGLPGQEELFEFTWAFAQRSESFREPVRGAVEACSRNLTAAVDKYGIVRLDQCLLMDFLYFCLDYEVAARCPADARQRANWPGVSRVRR